MAAYDDIKKKGCSLILYPFYFRKFGFVFSFTLFTFVAGPPCPPFSDAGKQLGKEVC